MSESRTAQIRMGLGFLACSVIASSCFSGTQDARVRRTQALTSQESLIVPPTSVQKNAYVVLEKYCLSCHAQWKSFQSDYDWQRAGLVKAGSMATSLLNSRIKFGSGLQDMPQGNMGAFTQGDYQAIVDWVTAMKPQGEPIPTGGLVSGQVIRNSNEATRIGDRTYVKSVLDSVFGPDAAATTTTLVGRMLSLYGGPCDPMQDSDRSTCRDADVSDNLAPMLPPSSTLREGQNVKVCNILAFNALTLSHAISQATGQADLAYLGSNPLPTPSEIVAAYQLFNPGRAPTPAIQTALANVAQGAQEAGKPLDPWRYVFLTLCYAPDWQMP